MQHLKRRWIYQKSVAAVHEVRKEFRNAVKSLDKGERINNTRRNIVCKRWWSSCMNMQFLRAVAISFDTWSSATNSSFLRSLDLPSVLVCVCVCCMYCVLSSCHENSVSLHFSKKLSFTLGKIVSELLEKFERAHVWNSNTFIEIYKKIKCHVSLWSMKRDVKNNRRLFRFVVI